MPLWTPEGRLPLRDSFRRLPVLSRAVAGLGEGLKGPSILDNRKLMDHMNENGHLQAGNRLKKGSVQLYATFEEKAR